MKRMHTEVRNTEPSDTEFIFELFEKSIQYQEQGGYPSWKNFDRNVILLDIENKNQYKILINEKPAIVFSVCYDDRITWRDHDKGESIYLHRIVVNPEFKGQRLFGKILSWAIIQCKERHLKNIRMDTWTANLNIINYYASFGFHIVENYVTPDSPELPRQNRNLEVTLLEFKMQ